MPKSCFYSWKHNFDFCHIVDYRIIQFNHKYPSTPSKTPYNCRARTRIESKFVFIPHILL